MSPEFWLQLAATVAGAAGIYAAIRADLVAARMRADHAHDRLTDHMSREHACHG